VSVIVAAPITYGTAEWKSPSFAEENQFGVSGHGNPFETTGQAEEWTIIQKAFLFGIILAIIAIWVKVTRRRDARDDVGYEKTMA